MTMKRVRGWKLTVRIVNNMSQSILNQLQANLDLAETKEELYGIAAQLNSRPEHVRTDKTTHLIFADFKYAKTSIQEMLNTSKKEVLK